MFFKRFNLGFHFGKKAAREDDIFSAVGPGQDIDRAAEALLTPMGDAVNREMARAVETPLPLLVEEADKKVAEVADALLTPMKDVKRGLAEESIIEKDAAVLKDIFTQPTTQGNLPAGEEKKGMVQEKNKESVTVEAEGKKKDGLIDDIFAQGEEEEASPIQGLIASLSEVTLQEVLGAAEEVKALMKEWRSK